MLNLKSILSIDTAVKVGGLGAGSVAANLVASKVTPKIIKDADKAAKFGPVLPILAGVVLSSGKTNSFLNAVGNGMIANAAGKVIAGLVDKDGAMGLGGDVMLGNVMLAGDGDSDLTSTSYDFTSAGTGEMDY